LFSAPTATILPSELIATEAPKATALARSSAVCVILAHPVDGSTNTKAFLPLPTTIVLPSPLIATAPPISALVARSFAAGVQAPVLLAKTKAADFRNSPFSRAPGAPTTRVLPPMATDRPKVSPSTPLTVVSSACWVTTCALTKAVESSDNVRKNAERGRPLTIVIQTPEFPA
jgi:hypothetical protein